MTDYDKVVQFIDTQVKSAERLARYKTSSRRKKRATIPRLTNLQNLRQTATRTIVRRPYRNLQRSNRKAQQMAVLVQAIATHQKHQTSRAYSVRNYTSLRAARSLYRRSGRLSKTRIGANRAYLTATALKTASRSNHKRRHVSTASLSWP